MTEAPIRRASGRDLLLVALLAALLFLPGLGARDLWNPDEPRYAEVAREMALLGEWLVPHLNGEVYSQKPPLLFWLIGLASLATGGLGEWAVRLPSAVAGIGAVLLTYLLGHRFFGRRAGWLAAAVFATSVKVMWQARFGQIDMVLVALVALAVWFWVRGYTEGRPRLYPLFFLFAGLATLAKGPVGLLPPLLSIVAFLLVAKDRGELRRLRIGLGLLLWAAVVLAWLVPAGIDGGGEYLRSIVVKQNVTRYANPWHHFQPPWYYLTIIPVDFFPWAVLLPGAVVLGWRRLRHSARELERKGYHFALCWAVVTLVFFSLSPAKRTVYILTMYPAMALLVGAVVDRIAGAWEAPGGAGPPRGERRWLTWPLALLAGVALLLPPAVTIAGRRHAEYLEPTGPGFAAILAFATGLLAAGAVAAFWLARRGRLVAAAGSLAAGTAAMCLVGVLVAGPRFDAVKSARPLSRALVARMAPGEPYAIYPRLDAPFLFYTGRFAVTLDGERELQEFVRRPGRKWLLIERDDLARLAEPLPLVEVARDRNLRDGYVLLTDPGGPRSPAPERPDGGPERTR
jgi:4-amino-4-deoxy-L-arabinose transferase-like glycosyltransferase